MLNVVITSLLADLMQECQLFQKTFLRVSSQGPVFIVSVHSALIQEKHKTSDANIKCTKTTVLALFLDDDETAEQQEIRGVCSRKEV